MKVLVACEFSGTVRDAFIRAGHDAMSCDLLPTESPGPHYQGNVLDLLGEKADQWDLMVAHPPCQYLANSGVRWLYRDGEMCSDRWARMEAGAAFFRRLLEAHYTPYRGRESHHPRTRQVHHRARAGPGIAALAVRPRRDEGDLPVAQESAEAGAHGHCGRQDTESPPRQPRPGQVERAIQVLHRDRGGDGETMGRVPQRHAMILNFGKFRLEQRGDDWWLIENGSDEGMTVKLHEIDELLQSYYSENF